MRRVFSALVRRRKVLLCLMLLALAGWGGYHLYNRFTASPAKWAQAMADGKVAVSAGDGELAVRHYTRAIREARKFGRRDLRLAESLEACANVRLFSVHRGWWIPGPSSFARMRDELTDAFGSWKTPGYMADQCAGAVADYTRVTAVERELREALALREGVQGRMHPDLLSILWTQGWLYGGTAEPARGRACWERALHIAETAYGPEDPRVAERCHDLAGFLEECPTGPVDTSARRAYLERAYAIRAVHVASDAKALVRATNALRDVLDAPEVLPLWERTLATLEAHHGPKAEVLCWPLGEIGRLHRVAGRLGEAEQMYRRVHEIKAPSGG